MHSHPQQLLFGKMLSLTNPVKGLIIVMWQTVVRKSINLVVHRINIQSVLSMLIWECLIHFYRLDLQYSQIYGEQPIDISSTGSI